MAITKDTLKELIVESLVEHGIEDSSPIKVETFHTDVADTILEKITEEDPDFFEEDESLFDESYDDKDDEEEEADNELEEWFEANEDED